jgi:hypothetical protein
MKLKKSFLFAFISLAALLASNVATAQVVRPIPADSREGTYRPQQVFVNPIASSNTCPSGQVYSGSTCVALSSGGGAGTFCGWVGVYNGAVGSRVPCNGNSLGIGYLGETCSTGLALTPSREYCAGDIPTSNTFSCQE